MQAATHLPPERMTPEQRRHEIAAILALGLIRLRSQGKLPINANQENQFGLGFSPEQSVHVHPANQALEDTP